MCGTLLITENLLKVKVLVTQSRLALCDPMDCNPAGSSVHGIVKAGILEWVAIQFFRGFFLTRELNLGLLHGRQILYHLRHHRSQRTSSAAVVLDLQKDRKLHAGPTHSPWPAVEGTPRGSGSQSRKSAGWKGGTWGFAFYSLGSVGTGWIQVPVREQGCGDGRP